MIDLFLLGLIGVSTVYGERIKKFLSPSQPPTLKVPQPGTNVAIQQNKNLTEQLRAMPKLPKYDLGIDMEDEDYTKVQSMEEPDVFKMYKSIDPTFQNYGYENIYQKLLRMRDEK